MFNFKTLRAAFKNWRERGLRPKAVIHRKKSVMLQKNDFNLGPLRQIRKYQDNKICLRFMPAIGATVISQLMQQINQIPFKAMSQHFLNEMEFDFENADQMEQAWSKLNNIGHQSALIASTNLPTSITRPSINPAEKENEQNNATMIIKALTTKADNSEELLEHCFSHQGVDPNIFIPSYKMKAIILCILLRPNLVKIFLCHGANFGLRGGSQTNSSPLEVARILRRDAVVAEMTATRPSRPLAIAECDAGSFEKNLAGLEMITSKFQFDDISYTTVLKDAVDLNETEKEQVKRIWLENYTASRKELVLNEFEEVLRKENTYLEIIYGLKSHDSSAKAVGYVFYQIMEDRINPNHTIVHGVNCAMIPEYRQHGLTALLCARFAMGLKRLLEKHKILHRVGFFLTIMSPAAYELFHDLEHAPRSITAALATLLFDIAKQLFPEDHIVSNGVHQHVDTRVGVINMKDSTSKSHLMGDYFWNTLLNIKKYPPQPDKYRGLLFYAGMNRETFRRFTEKFAARNIKFPEHVIEFSYLLRKLLSKRVDIPAINPSVLLSDKEDKDSIWNLQNTFLHPRIKEKCETPIQKRHLSIKANL